jgi:hypothetical protein
MERRPRRRWISVVCFSRPVALKFGDEDLQFFFRQVQQIALGQIGAAALEFGIFGEKPPHQLHHFRSQLDHPQLPSDQPSYGSALIDAASRGLLLRSRHRADGAHDQEVSPASSPRSSGGTWGLPSGTKIEGFSRLPPDAGAPLNEHPSFAGARSANRLAKMVENLEIFSYIHQVMKMKETAKNVPEIESVQSIEPARLEEVPEAVSDAVAELSAASAKLGHSLHPRTATSLSGSVRIMNTYYSNLIEGHNTRPRTSNAHWPDNLTKIPSAAIFKSKPLRTCASRPNWTEWIPNTGCLLTPLLSAGKGLPEIDGAWYGLRERFAHLEGYRRLRCASPASSPAKHQLGEVPVLLDTPQNGAHFAEAPSWRRSWGPPGLARAGSRVTVGVTAYGPCRNPRG